MNTKIGLVIQARMGSTRLPGKVLTPLCGIPVLLRIINQLELLPVSYQRIIITSTLKRDDIIETFCKSYNIHCFRGSEDDVLDRYYQTAKHYNLDHIVRITADNPFIDPAYTHRLIRDHIKTGVDYSTNKSESSHGWGLPIGIGCEIFTKSALERSWLFGLLQPHREHVNEYILENKSRFRVLEQQPAFSKECSSLRLTLDTKEDFVFLERVARLLEERHMDISVKNICKLHQEGLL